MFDEHDAGVFRALGKIHKGQRVSHPSNLLFLHPSYVSSNNFSFSKTPTRHFTSHESVRSFIISRDVRQNPGTVFDDTWRKPTKGPVSPGKSRFECMKGDTCDFRDRTNNTQQGKLEEVTRGKYNPQLFSQNCSGENVTFDGFSPTMKSNPISRFLFSLFRCVQSRVECAACGKRESTRVDASKSCVPCFVPVPAS